VGSSTGRPWTRGTLPNFKLDADQFTPEQRIAGFEHLRLNNAVVGSIYREKLTLDLYQRLGYPNLVTAIPSVPWTSSGDVRSALRQL
jgi:hypothetical protein